MNLALDYRADTHEYRIDGKRVPSVTQVLRPLYSWLDWIDPNVRDRKALIGTYVDEAIGLDLGPGVDPDSIDESCRPYFDAWLLFRRECNYRHIAYQEKLFNARYGYAGTLDLRGHLNEWPSIIDIKCVTVLSPAVALQTSGYAGALSEPHKRYALRLCGNGRYRLQAYDDPSDRSVFLSMLTAHKWKERNGLTH